MVTNWQFAVKRYMTKIIVFKLGQVNDSPLGLMSSLVDNS